MHQRKTWHPQQNFTPSLNAGDKPRGPKPCAEPGTMNSPSRFHCSCVIWGSNQPQAFLASLRPRLQVCHCSVGSALARLCELCGSAHSADTVRAQNIHGEAAAISAATFAIESRAAPSHTGVPRTAKSLPLQISLTNSQREKKHRLNLVLQNLAWVQAAYCSLQLCGKTVTWYLHLQALCL